MNKNLLKLSFLYLLTAFLSINIQAQESFFDVFNNLGVNPASSQGSSTLSSIGRNDSWSFGTEWASQPWDEDDVFHTELQHSSSDLNWNIRIGKGGQLYSWNLAGTGELIPPQGGTSQRSAWVDEVVMQTWRDSDHHYSDALMNGYSYGNAFVHGAGMYAREDMDSLMKAENPFYHPMFVESFNSTNRTYSCINWGPPPTPSINRGEVMFYTNYRHLGDNVLEITYYGYNFGDNTYNDIAMPWAMVRNSIFPNTIKSMPDGISFESFEGIYPTRFDIKDAGGWVAKTQSATDPKGLTISTVHGLDRHYGEIWQSSATRCSSGISSVVNSTRDITVMSAFNNRTEIEPGQGFFKRIYMVLGEQDDVIAKSYSLVDYVDYGFVEFNESASSELLPVYASTSSGENILTTTDNSTSPVFFTYALPVKNSIPLFLMKSNDDDKYYLSTDPYALCGKKNFVDDTTTATTYSNRHIYQPYDGKTEWVSLLGYVMPTTKATFTEDTVALSSVLSSAYNFTAGEKYASASLLVRAGGALDTGIREAELASINHGSIKTNSDASNGSYVDGNGGFNLTWDVSSDSSSTTTLKFRIKTPSGSRSMGVYVNGLKVGNVKTSLTTWNTKQVIVTLASGINTIELRDSEGTTELDVDYLEIVPAVIPDNTIILEENNICSLDGVIQSSHSGYTGTGYANTHNASGNGINWEISGLAGSYTFTWTYASSSSRPANLIINGVTESSNIVFSSTGSWSTYGDTSSITVSLTSGVKSISLQASTSSGLGNIDSMTITGPNAAISTCTIAAKFFSDKLSKDESTDIKVYPNPVGSILYIANSNGAVVELYNVVGSLILTYNVESNKHSIDISSLNNGIYFIKIKQNGLMKTEKIIKQ